MNETKLKNNAPHDEDTNKRKEALRAATEAHGAFIRDYFVSKVHDHAIAKDLWQDFWLHVFKKFEVQDFTNPVRLRQKAYQIFMANRRKENVRRYVEFRPDVPDVIDERHGMLHTLTEESRFLRDFGEQFPGVSVPDLHKRAFFLNRLAGYSLKEVSKMLHVPVSTLHDWIAALIAQCRRHLER